MKTCFDFGQFEPRQMLASISTPLPAETNMIQNGQFETVVNDGPLYESSDVTNWGAVLSGGRQQINLFETASKGNILELDSTAEQLDRVFHDVDTESGENYVLAFEFRERPAGADADPFSNHVDVFWNGESQGTLAADTQWQTAVYSVTGGSDDLTRLEFREIESGNDGIGPLIDNVRLVKATDSVLGNGSFENVTGGDGELYDAADVDSWQAVGRDPSDRIIRVVDGAEATDGLRLLNLETKDTHVDRIFQRVATIPAATYFLMFDVKGDSEASEESNELRVRWNDGWAGTFQGGSEWHSVGLLLSANTDTTRLVFRETGSGAGSGPLIDNVRIKMVTTPTPVESDLSVDLAVDSVGKDTVATFTEDSGPTSIVESLDLLHPSNDQLTSATVKIENLLDGDAEVLSVDVGNSGLNAFYDSITGRLGISGEASIETYEAVLSTLMYSNTSENPSLANRSVSVSISDTAVVEGNNFSPRSFIDLSVFSVNDAPLINSIPDANADFGSTFAYSVVAEDGENSPLTYSLSTVGDVGTNEPTIDQEGQITWNVVADSGDVEFTVEVADEDGAKSQMDFMVTVEGFEPFAGNRQLTGIEPELRDGIYSAPPELMIDTSKQYVAVLKTDVGDIEILLLDNEAPITVNNFYKLVEDGFYDGLDFHRVIENFVAQGGDPLGTGTGGPGYQFVDEIVAGLEFIARGLLAMANSGPGTNGSQFFITYSAQPHLTGLHTIFGRVIGGDSVLDAITRTSSGDAPTIINSIEIIVT